MSLTIEAAIFDYGRTLHDPDTDQLFPQVTSILEHLREHHVKLALVSRGQDVTQRRKDITRLGLDNFFDVVDVVAQSSAKEFDKILERLNVVANRSVVIGDRIRSEIVEGNRVGAATIWFKQGKFRDEVPETLKETPNYTITSLDELLPVLNSFS